LVIVVFIQYTGRSKSCRHDFLKEIKYIWGRYVNFLIQNKLHCHMYRICAVIDRLVLKKKLRQLSVHFCHPWRVKKTDFTRQVVTHTLSKISRWNSVCKQMLVDSIWLLGWPIDRSTFFFFKSVLKLMDHTVSNS
jgi:hypothetical protein